MTIKIVNNQISKSYAKVGEEIVLRVSQSKDQRKNLNRKNKNQQLKR